MSEWILGIVGFCGFVGGGALVLQVHERHCYLQYLRRHIWHLKVRMAARPGDTFVCRARIH